MDTSTMILELSQATGIVGMEAGAVRTAEKCWKGAGTVRYLLWDR